MTPASLGESAETCPHCGAMALVEPSPSLRWRCAVCGGGRVPGLPAASLGGHAVSALVAARRGRAVEVAAGIGALVLGVSALTTGLLAAFALRHAAVVAGGLLLGLAIVFGVGAWASFRAHRRASAAWRVALDDAWTDAAEKIARGMNEPLTNASLGARMLVSEEVADSILSQLSLEGARVSVGDDAVLHYRVGPTIDVLPMEPDDAGSDRRERERR